MLSLNTDENAGSGPTGAGWIVHPRQDLLCQGITVQPCPQELCFSSNAAFRKKMMSHLSHLLHCDSSCLKIAEGEPYLHAVNVAWISPTHGCHVGQDSLIPASAPGAPVQRPRSQAIFPEGKLHCIPKAMNKHPTCHLATSSEPWQSWSDSWPKCLASELPRIETSFLGRVCYCPWHMWALYHAHITSCHPGRTNSELPAKNIGRTIARPHTAVWRRIFIESNWL